MTRSFGTARLHAFVVLAVVGLGAALATGRPELAALAAPFAVALVVGIAASDPPSIEVAVEPDADRVVQGETLTVTVTLRADRDTEPVEVLLDLPPEHRRRRTAGPARVGGRRARRRAAGAHGHCRRALVGSPRRRPRGAWHARARAARVGIASVRAPTVVRVLPDAGTLRRIVRPFETRNDSGHQVARAPATGSSSPTCARSARATAPAGSTGGSARGAERPTSTTSIRNATPKRCCSSIRSPTIRRADRRRSTGRCAPRARSPPRCSRRATGSGS